jgi:hypothetical protein
MRTATISPLIIEGKYNIENVDKKGAPTNVDSRSRLVWLLARPLPNVISISSVGAGGFPILHWAIFISHRSYGKERMKSLFETLQSWPPTLQHFSIGMIQEIRFDQSSGQTIRRSGELSTAIFLQEFQTSSIAYVGMTYCTDLEINDFGTVPS